ncbi:hypothetical protein [Pararhodonellum marinum]|uniref:hypothetical protein n=1 Tax=Pararhodonellum marinum TaxID=2755358 RepID=UPI00188F26A6|nr:hypothetical protein [Pararhodonellum marinum]
MKTHTILCTVLCLTVISTTLHAQRYGSSFGIRLGNNDYSRMVGITAQQRVFDRVTLEGIVQSDFKLNSTAHVLVKKHAPIISKRFNYYYGAGISAGVEESYVKNPETMQINQTYGNPTMGADLMVGIEMTVLNTVISLDYKPNVNIVGREEFYRGQVGISARTVLVKSKEQKKKKRKKARAKAKRKKNANSKNNAKPFFESISDPFKKKP